MRLGLSDGFHHANWICSWATARDGLLHELRASHTLAGHARSDTSHLDLSDRGESNSIWYDEFDSSGLDPAEKQKYLDQFQVKINKTKEQIKREQLERDSNVDEYLR